jgi:hypothetical protein
MNRFRLPAVRARQYLSPPSASIEHACRSGSTIAPMPIFGENGEEAIMPLRRGPDGRLGVAAGGASGSTIVNIHNHTDAQPSVQTVPNGDVTVTLRRAMDAAAAGSLSDGAGRGVLSQQFGLKPFTRK